MDEARARKNRPRRRGRNDDGASLVEFAIIMPVLFLLVFGIIEFGWAFLQNLDVRHGAREGSRIAAVNMIPANGEATQSENLAREVCDRMDDYVGDEPLISISVDRGLVLPNTTADIGDEVSITVTKQLDQLTGFLGFALNDVDLTSSVNTRLEQPGTYGDLVNFQC